MSIRQVQYHHQVYLYICILNVHENIAGFISIDCGLSGETGYVDDTTKISYAPDAGYIDAGTNHNISDEHLTPSMYKHWHNVRSFAGTRNCYTLRSLESGLKYIIRANFLYGNYDGLNFQPVFDLYIGVNYWHTVNISGPGAAVYTEATVVVPEDSVQVCLVNTGGGTPFISSLELRPLKRTLYPQATTAQGLNLISRLNVGLTDDTNFIRYPDDPHDRIWYPWVDSVTWTEISTTKEVRSIDNGVFEAPSAVLRTAIMPRNASQNLKFTWSSQPTPFDPSPGYIVILHLTELQVLGNAVRELNVVFNDETWYTSGFRPDYLYGNALYITKPVRNSSYSLSIEATSNATLRPSINALEVFTVFPTTNLGTDSQDGMSCKNVLVL